MGVMQKSFMPPEGIIKEQWMRPGPIVGAMRAQFWRTEHWLRVNPSNALFAAMQVPKEKRHLHLDDAGELMLTKEPRLFLGPDFRTSGAREVYYEPRLRTCRSAFAR